LLTVLNRFILILQHAFILDSAIDKVLRWTGIGFMVSPQLLLTNHHVPEEAASGHRACVAFNFRDDSDGNALPPATFSLDPDAFFLTSQPLVFTLIAVGRLATEGLFDLEEIGWSRLIEAEGKAINGEYVAIIQHPNGQPKQIALLALFDANLGIDDLRCPQATKPLEHQRHPRMRGEKAGINSVIHLKRKPNTLRRQLRHQSPPWCHVHPLGES